MAACDAAEAALLLRPPSEASDSGAESGGASGSRPASGAASRSQSGESSSSRRGSGASDAGGSARESGDQPDAARSDGGADEAGSRGDGDESGSGSEESSSGSDGSGSSGSGSRASPPAAKTPEPLSGAGRSGALRQTRLPTRSSKDASGASTASAARTPSSRVAAPRRPSASSAAASRRVPLLDQNLSVTVRGIEFTPDASGSVVPTAGSSASAAQRFARLYKVTMIIGRVRNVRVLVRSVRDTEHADVKKYINSFSTTGYDWAHGMIKVTEDFTLGNQRAFDPLVVGEDGVLEDKSDRQYVTVDGHHRQMALVTVLERKLPNASETCRYALVKRRDGKPMTETEVLSLGFDSNESTVQTKAMDTADVVVFLCHWVLGRHNERRAKHQAGLKLGVTQPSELMDELLKEKIGGLCKNDGTLAYGDASMRRMINIGLLSLEDNQSTRYMVEKLKASKVKDGCDGSFSLDTLISPIMLHAETIHADKKAVRLLLLKMAWEYTCHRTADKKVRRLVAGSDGSFYACAVLFIKHLQDATLNKIKEKGGTPNSVRSLWSGKGKQPAGAPAAPSVAAPAPASAEESVQAATIHASTGSLDLLQQTRPGATMTLGDELTTLFVQDFTEAGLERARGGSSVSKLVLAATCPFVVEHLPRWKRMVAEFIEPPPPPPPPPRAKKVTRKKQTRTAGTKTKSKRGKKTKARAETSASADEMPPVDQADPAPAVGGPSVAGGGAETGPADAVERHNGGNQDADKAGAGGEGGPCDKDGDAAGQGGGNAAGAGDADGGDRVETAKTAGKRKPEDDAEGDKRRSKRSRHPPPELGQLVPVPSEQQLRKEVYRGTSVRAKSPFARAVRRVGVNGRRQGRHDIRNQVADKLYEDTVPPISETYHEDAAANRREILEPYFGPPGSSPPPVPVGHYRVPSFAALLPTEHQARDMVPGADWIRIEQTTSTFMAQQGIKLLSGMPGVPTSLPDDNPGMISLLGGAACLAYAKTLVERGWVIIENAVSDAMPILDADGPPSVHAVLKHYVDLFPGEAEIAKVQAGKSTARVLDVWAPIHNIDKDLDKAALADGQGRFSVPVNKVACSEDDTECEVFSLKLHADACMAAIANKVLEAVPAAEGRPSARPVVRTPKTGARLLLTTENAVRQRPHIDSGLLEDKLEQETVTTTQEAGGPSTGAEAVGERAEDEDVQFVSAKKYKMPLTKGFFMMASGYDPFVLAVWPGSVLALRRIEDGHLVDRTLVSEVIEIPKNSVLLCRSDLVHAGCGADEDISRINKAPVELAYSRSVRLHMYLQHPCQPLKDAIFPVSRVTFASNAIPQDEAIAKAEGDDQTASPGGKKRDNVASQEEATSAADGDKDVVMEDAAEAAGAKARASSSAAAPSEPEAAADVAPVAEAPVAMEGVGEDEQEDGAGSAKDASVNRDGGSDNNGGDDGDAGDDDGESDEDKHVEDEEEEEGEEGDGDE